MTFIIYKLFHLLKSKKPGKKSEYISKSSSQFKIVYAQAIKLKETANKIISKDKVTKNMLEEALNKYTEAINLKLKDKINSILYSNRAWVNLKLEKNGAALDDANHAIKWDPDNIKGYYRRGKANLALLKYEDALIDLEYAYEKYPENIAKEKIDEIKFELSGFIVRVADDDHIEYENEKYSLSDFCKKFDPHKSWKSYQGPKYFSYNGKTLKEIRDDIENN